MSIDTALQRCAVLGAAGKMGRGIALLLLQEMARSEVTQYGSTGTGHYHLILIDRRLGSLIPLRRYLRSQLQRYAEKNISTLRQAYAANAALVSNQDIITSFIEGALDIVSCSTELAAALPAYLVFEALPEDIPLKTQALQALHSLATEPQYYFSNTSSIPICLLDGQAELQGTLVGLHFYNPPPAQKLIELVTLPEGIPDAIHYAEALATRLGKVAVTANDLPGFIGNGFFMREVAFACRLADQLAPLFGWPGALYAVDMLTRTFLLRPMGIFQLIDYVGIDICSQIATTMGSLLQDSEIIVPRLAAMTARGILGGQDPEGQPQAGFFLYHQEQPKAIYNDLTDKYTDLNDESLHKVGSLLGPLPPSYQPWKKLSASAVSETWLAAYFQELSMQPSLGATLALAYLNTCRLIAKALIASGVAKEEADVSAVLQLGFHHLYSPLADWLPTEHSPGESSLPPFTKDV